MEAIEPKRQVERIIFAMGMRAPSISRLFPEWGATAVALSAAVAVILTGDHRLGAYLVWNPGASEWGLGLGGLRPLPPVAAAPGLAILESRPAGPGQHGDSR